MDPVTIWFIIGGGFVLIFVYVLVQFLIFKIFSRKPLDMHGGMMRDARMPHEEETAARAIDIACGACGKKNPLSERTCSGCGRAL